MRIQGYSNECGELLSKVAAHLRVQSNHCMNLAANILLRSSYVKIPSVICTTS